MTQEDTTIPVIWRSAHEPPTGQGGLAAFVRMTPGVPPSLCWLRGEVSGASEDERPVWFVELGGEVLPLEYFHSWMPRAEGQQHPEPRPGGVTDPSLPLLLPGPYSVHRQGVYRGPNRGVSHTTSSRGGKVAEACSDSVAFGIAQTLNDHALKSAELEDLREHLGKLSQAQAQADFATASIPRPEDVLARLQEWAKEARRIIDR